MAKCKNISPPNRTLCAGDLKDIIKVQIRTLSPKKIDDPDYTEDFSALKTIRASVQTTRGFQSFNQVGISAQIQNNITHKIYIRFSTSYNISSEEWIEFKNGKYIIRDVENLDERNEWIILYCIKKGNAKKLANFA